MEYRFLGKSGLKISALSLGSWITFGDQIGEDVAAACMKAAWEAGVNFFDTAEGYARGKAESMMGAILKKFGWKRSDLVVSTKIFWGGNGPNDSGLSRKHIFEGLTASLITGASRADQVVENMKAVAVAKKLSSGVMAKIEKILGNKPRPEPDFRSW